MHGFGLIKIWSLPRAQPAWKQPCRSSLAHMRKAATSLAYSSPRFRPHPLSLLKRLTVLAGPTDELAKLYLGRPRRLTQASRPRLFYQCCTAAIMEPPLHWHASSTQAQIQHQAQTSGPSVSVACAYLHNLNGEDCSLSTPSSHPSFAVSLLEPLYARTSIAMHPNPCCAIVLFVVLTPAIPASRTRVPTKPVLFICTPSRR